MRLEEFQQAPLLGAIRVPAGGLAYWRTAWSPRHLVATSAAGIVLFGLLFSALPGAGALAVVLLGLAALLGGIAVATYLPPAGVPVREHIVGGSCALMPLAIIAFAPLALLDVDASPLVAVAVLVFYAGAALKRLTSHASC